MWAKKIRCLGPDQVSMAVPVDMSSGFGVLEYLSFMIYDFRLRLHVFLAERF
jgi:hypothetical protein